MSQPWFRDGGREAGVDHKLQGRSWRKDRWGKGLNGDCTWRTAGVHPRLVEDEVFPCSWDGGGSVLGTEDGSADWEIGTLGSWGLLSFPIVLISGCCYYRKDFMFSWGSFSLR